MGDVSARPANLNTFAGDQASRASALQAAAESLDDAFLAFVVAPGGGEAGSGRATVETDVPTVVEDFKSLGEYVKLLHEAILRADVAVVNGVVTIDHDKLLQEFNRVAAENGTTVDQLSKVEVRPTAPLPKVTTVPPSSGYVNDPVCTSTGYLVAASMDFVMPARLLMLAGERTYASGSEHAGAFGRGWCSWFDVRLERHATGLVLVSNDAQRVDLRDGDRCAAVGLTAVEHDSGVTVRWGASSRRGLQVWEFDGDGRLVTVSAELLGVTEFVRDRTGRVIELRHDSGRSVAYRWEAERVVEAVSSDGRRAECRYDDRGDIIELVNAIDPLRFDLDDEGRIVRIIDADDVVRVEMEYDDESRVICQRNAMGTATRFSYVAPYRTTVRDGDGDAVSVYVHDDSGHVKMAATVDGLQLTQRFDERGRVTAQSYPDGRNFVVNSSETESGRVEERIWSTGLLETFEFDQQDRLARHSTSIAADQTTSTVPTYEGDSALPSHLELPDGSTFDIEWQYGIPVRITDADGVTVTSTVDADGTATAVVDGIGNQQTFEYHASGRISGSTYPDGDIVSFERDAAGRTTRMVSTDGTEMTFDYTAAGRLRSIVDPNGAVYRFEYHASGLIRAVIDPLGHRTEFGFDDWERLVRIGLADGSTVGYDLDVCGRIIGIAVDESAWQATRDTAGRLTKTVDPVGRTTQYAYSADGLAASVSDPTGATWRYAFDAAMRLVNIETADGNEVEFDPTPTGQNARVVDEAGVEHVTTYTPGGRIASQSEGEALIGYGYDGAGRVSSIDAGSGPWQIERDGRGRIVSATTPEGRRRTIEYDRGGRVVATTTGNERWSFKYDRAGQLIESIDPTGRRVELDYDLAGRVVSAIDPAGATTRYEYDERGRPLGMTDALGAEWRYSYDTLNKVVSVASPHADEFVVARDLSGRAIATRYAAETTVRGLDAAGREVIIEGPDDLTRFERAAGGDTAEVVADGYRTSLGWSADGGLRQVGDLSNVTRPQVETDRDGLIVAVSSDTRRVELERDLSGRVVRQTDLAIDPVAGTATITSEVVVRRDPGGRVVERRDDAGVHQFAYDRAGRLVGSTTTSGEGDTATVVAQTWEYDILGRLVSEQGPNGTRTYEYGNGHQLVALSTPSGSTRFEYDERGQRIASYGEINARYEWGELGLRRSVVEGIEVESVPGAVGLPISVGGVDIAWDIPGSIGLAYAPGVDPVDVLVTSQCGSLGSTTWGEIATPSASPQWHPFHGLAAGGLVWLGNRVYDPLTRQFLSPDPAPMTKGATSGTWTYHYAAADPINLIDPWGTAPISIDDFNRIMDDATSVQWKNIAIATVIVVAAVAAPTLIAFAGTGMVAAGMSTAAANIVAPVVVGGLLSGGVDVATQLIGTGTVDWGQTAKATITGAVFGGVFGSVGRLAPVSNLSQSNIFGSMAVNAGSAFLGEMGSQAYDVIPGLPGADGEFNVDPASLAVNVAVGTATGTAGDAVNTRWGPTVTITAEGSDVYHTEASPYFNRIKNRDNVFFWPQQAANAGYRPAKPMLQADPKLPQPVVLESLSD